MAYSDHYHYDQLNLATDERTEGEGTSNWQNATTAAESGGGQKGRTKDEERKWRRRRRRSTQLPTEEEKEEKREEGKEKEEKGEKESGTWPWPCSSSSSAFAASQPAQFRPPFRHRPPPPLSLAHCPRPSPSLPPSFAFSSPVLFALPLLLFLTLSSLFHTANARKSNEIEVDWSQFSRTLPSSPLARSEQLGRQFVPTKYLRLKEVLRFVCPPPNLPLAIHLVPAESALLCQLPAEQRERERALIGYCGPNTSDPRLTIRQYSPLPGKPTFREGLSYFFISTSDGTADGVQAISGGLCRSNALRLRVVVLPTPSEDALSSSRPADEITDLAELLFPHSPSSSVPPPSPRSAPAVASFGVFPAVLTLEDRAGQRRQVLVHSPAELAAQIDSASQHSGGGGLELSVHQQQQRRRGGGVEDGQMPRYEMSSSGREADNKHPAKQVRSPDPMAESQKLVYIIGYGESGAGGHEQTNHGSALGPSTATLAFAILMAMVFTISS
ncbi:hypothetical protein niasHS_011107 [Heterodera schachtii]|uniref:Ephrin RBD domain-containing protein n=1 Tax=Heterodera schachtii TaxID=97005 RepID=A0ABD2J063_HETSC